MVSKYLEVLGDGQIWDVQGIDPLNPEKTFEDLFSGRVLGEMARTKRVFCRFKEKGKVSGLSVTRALLSHSPAAKKAAKRVLQVLAKNGALGIEALTKGRGRKKKWSALQRNYWKDIEMVVIGGGVSEGKTGRLLVNFINGYLRDDGFSGIKVYQARFPGKEAGILGAVIKMMHIIGKEAEKKRLKAIAGIGLDLGRDDIGAGLYIRGHKAAPFRVRMERGRSVFRSRKLRALTRGASLAIKKVHWLYNYSAKTPYKKYLKKFLDSRRDYRESERKLGRRIRRAIVARIGDLVIKAQNRAKELGLACSGNIGVAVPGAPAADGSILNSTDYLPFFRKKDGFNFSRNLEKFLRKKTLHNYRVYIINDGIAAGIANIYFACPQGKKFAFLGVGSGLGGCVGRIGKR